MRKTYGGIKTAVVDLYRLLEIVKILVEKMPYVHGFLVTMRLNAEASTIFLTNIYSVVKGA